MSKRLRATPWFRSELEEENTRHLHRMNSFLRVGAPGQLILVSNPQAHVMTPDPQDEDLMRRFWDEAAVWSQETFGPDWWKGPLGPLEHLAKEVIETQKDPGNPEEYADLMHLIFDAARRAGMRYEDLILACFSKLEKNKKREWGPWRRDGAVEHDRSKD